MRTLRNAFAAERIAHAFVLTGVRGVGKTTTARIIAKGLNCTGPDGQGRADDRALRGLRGLRRHRRGAACRRAGDGRRLADRRRRHPRDHRRGGVPGGERALQGLHHRRGAHAEHLGVQRAPEDAGGAAGACEVHLRHHRDPQGAGDGAVALPALRPAADRAGGDARLSRADRRGRGGEGGAGRHGADHPRGGGVDARRAVAPRPGDRARGGRGDGGGGAGDARARRPRAGARPLRGGDARRRARGRWPSWRRSTRPGPIRWR